MTNNYSNNIIPATGTSIVEVVSLSTPNGNKLTNACYFEFYATRLDAQNGVNQITTGLAGDITPLATPSNNPNPKYMKIPDVNDAQVVINVATDDPALSWEGLSAASLKITSTVTGCNFIKVFFESAT